jgi:hypothetical protein
MFSHCVKLWFNMKDFYFCNFLWVCPVPDLFIYFVNRGDLQLTFTKTYYNFDEHLKQFAYMMFLMVRHSILLS